MRTITTRLIALSAVLWMMFAGCSFDPPGAPIWTIQGTIPFNQRTYRLAELITDSTKYADQGWGILADSTADSLLRFEYFDTFDEQVIGDQIKYEASDTSSYVNEIGLIHIDEPSPDSAKIKVKDINPQLENYHGPIPPFDFEDAEDELTFDVFRWIDISEGTVELRVINDFPFALENLTVSLINLPQRDTIDQAVFNETILPGGSAQRILNLSGKTVRNNILMSMNGHSPGRNDDVDVSGEETLTIVAAISETEVVAAEAQVDRQDFEETDVMEIDNPNRIVRAELKIGRVFLDLQNTTPFTVNVDITFQNIFDADHNRLVKQLVIGPEGDLPLETIDLSNHSIEMELDRQILEINAYVVIESTGDDYVEIRSEQGVEISYWTDQFTLHAISGVLDSIQVDIPELETPIDIPEGLDNIRFVGGLLVLDINSSVEAPAVLDASLTGTNSSTGESAVLPVRIERLVVGNNHIEVPDTVGLIGIIPDTIRITGSAGVGWRFFGEDERNRVVTISEDQGFSGAFKFLSGMKLIIDDTHMESDLMELDSPLDYPIEGADISVVLTNTVPLSGSVYILLGNDSTAMDTIAMVDIPPPTILNHRAIEPVLGAFNINLSTDKLDILRQLPIYSRQLITFNGTNGEEAWLYAEDSLSVQASATVFYTVNLKGEDDD